jgi:RNA polymerase sigma factor (sigma-70 family)
MIEEMELAVARDDRLERLYAQMVPRAEALARALTGDPHLAQDIAHDAFIRVVGRFGHLRQPGSFDAYVRRTVVNLCRSHFRRASAERRGFRKVGVGDDRSSAQPSEDRHALWNAIQVLPYRQRAAIVLRFYEDLSEAETGAILRCSSRAVNSLVSRAMVTLRAGMEER